MGETKHHDGTPRDVPGSPPAALIGALRSVSDTTLPRPGFWPTVLGAVGTAGAASTYMFLKASAKTVGRADMHVSLLLVSLPVIIATVFVIGFVLLWVTSAGPIRTWVGDDGVAIAKRRWMGHGASFRFAELASLELLTTHAYVASDRHAAEPRHRALVFKLIVRTRTGDRLSIAGEAPYREPCRSDDDRDRAPETFAHLGHDHRYWLARAIEAAWVYRAGAGGDS